MIRAIIRGLGSAEAPMQTQQPDNQKNLLLAIILSVVVLLGWQVFFANPKLKEEQERLRRSQQEAANQTTGGPAPGSQAPVAPGVTPPGTPTPPAPTRGAALAASPRITIDTPSLRGSIALKGARID